MKFMSGKTFMSASEKFVHVLCTSFFIKKYEALEIIEVMHYISLSNGNKMAWVSTNI